MDSPIRFGVLQVVRLKSQQGFAGCAAEILQIRVFARCWLEIPSSCAPEIPQNKGTSLERVFFLSERGFSGCVPEIPIVAWQLLHLRCEQE